MRARLSTLRVPHEALRSLLPADRSPPRCGGHRHQEGVHSRVVGELRVERAQQDLPLRAPRPGARRCSARTSTSEPCCSIHGARMNTALIGSGPSPSIASSASKLAIWRPKAFRRATASTKPRCSRSQTIIPAQVPRIGRPASSVRADRVVQSVALDRLGDRGALAAGDRPGRPAREARPASGPRARSAPSDSSARAWAAKSPWLASTPIRRREGEAGSGGTGSAALIWATLAGASSRRRAAAAARHPPRALRCRHRASARRARSRPRRPARRP